VVVQIKPDIHCELEKIRHMQYVCFRATFSGVGFADNGSTSRPTKTRYILNNASQTSYPEAWTGSTVFYSTDVGYVDSWKRNV
jgi:hypothetical protein